MALLLSDYTKTKHKGLFINKVDPCKFLFNFRIHGKSTRKIYRANLSHTKVDRLRMAYSELERLKAVVNRVEVSGADLTATVQNYFDRLQEITERNMDTQKMYANHYKKYIEPTIGKLKIVDVTARHISTITALTKHLAKATQQKTTSILIPMFNLAIDEELIQFSPIKNIHKAKRKQLEEKKIINDAVNKYKLVYEAIFTAFADNPKIRALFLFGFYCRRKTETLKLKWDDIDFVNNSYTIRGFNSKINTDMSFSLPQVVREALMECEHYGEYIFCSNRYPSRPISEIREHVAKVRDITVPEYSFHWMRNLAVSALSAMGTDTVYLSAMLGHTDTNTVKQYLSLQRETSSAKVLDVSKKLLS